MATRKILFRGQTRRKGEKTSISGKLLPGIWVTGGIFPQNKGYERAIIYTQDPKVEKHVVYAETVGQYTGVDDVLETPVFEDDIITFWQRTDTKHMQRYKGTVKYDEALTSFTVVSCEPNRLSAPLFLWDCSDLHVVGNIFDGELSKREQEVSCTYAKRSGRERPTHPGRERRLEEPPGGHHRLERQRECGDLAGGMGGLHQPGIGGRRSSRPGRPPQLQAPGH